MPNTFENLTQQYNEQTDQLDAILKVAEEDGGRRLSEDEAKQYAELETEAEKLQTEIEAIEAHRQRVQRQQARRDFQSQPRTRLSTPAPVESTGAIADRQFERLDRSTLIYPLRRHGRLRAFRGPTAEEDAYLFGMFGLATLFRDQKAINWCRSNGYEHLAQSSGVDTAGGFLVPEEFSSTIIDLKESYGVARQECEIEPMAGDTKTVPVRKTGVTAYFVGENTAITESEMSWGQAELVARKLAALSRFSSEIDEDSVVSIGDKLAKEMAYAMAVKEDDCLFLGDGKSTYGGIVGLITAIQAGGTYDAISGNTAFSTLDLADFENMIGKLPNYPGINPKWYIHKAGWAASMMRLADAAGGNTIETLENGSRRRSFLGFEVVFVNSMNSTLTAQTSTTGLVYHGDLSMSSLLGSRREIRVMLSDQRYFAEDQIGIRCTQRFDIVNHSVGDATNAGAIVVLKTPAS